ncbi:hypothetical protein Lser_V15G33945 [Lactuca serriola]
MRSSSTKQVAENNRGLNGRFFTLRSRLYNALALGLRNDEGGRRWCCTDVETQRHVVRSIDAFLDCISSDTSQHPLVKESLADIIPALGTTLIQKNEAVMKLASKVFVRMISVVPSTILESLVLDVVHPVSSSLSSCHESVVISCATALNLILSSLSSKKEKEVWKILEETETIDNLIHHIRSSGSKPAEFFLETISLLSKILWRFPSSRFCVWNNTPLMEVVASLMHEPILSVKASVLQLYSTIALCSNGAEKILNSGNSNSLLQMMVECMNGSNPNYLQLAGFTLAECFSVSEKGRLKMVESYCEPLVKAIVNGLSLHSHSGKLTKEQMSLIKVSCCVSKIICWPGKHHMYFWKLGIESVLVKLLLDDLHIKKLSQFFLSSEDFSTMARDCLSANFLLVIKPHVWDILGGLAAHCAEDFNANMLQNEFYLNILITCACLGFVDSLRSTRQSCRNAVHEPVSRAVLLMIYSPSKYISSMAKSILSGMLKPNAKEDIKYLLNTLNASSSSLSSGVNIVSDNLQVINLISLACYSGLPQYRRYVIKNQGIKILLSFIQKLSSSNHVHGEGLNNNTSKSLHYCDHNMKMCCYGCEEDWEGEESFLVFGLLGLAELVHHVGSVKGNNVDWFELTESEMISEVEKICINSCASGSRCYGAYLLSYFGVYGFPSKLGNRIGNVLSGDEDEHKHTNLRLILANQEHVNVHGVIVSVGCPSLLPSEGKTIGRKEIRLSSHVNHQALLKLLEYVYSGHLKAEDEVVKRLKTLAKHCNLQPLLQLLCRNRPKWRTRAPTFDLTPALGPNGSHFSDIVLEAKGDTYEGWMCETCSVSHPHLHAHKAILCASCEHMRALLCSGMQESHSESIKVDLGWEALVRLVNWFYSGKLRPKPKYGCLWHNLNEKEKLDEVIPYVELYCLSDSWLLEELHKECSRVIGSCLDSVKMAIKIIQIGADCFQWDLVELAAKFIAPSYHHLRNSGELLQLDEQLVDIVRVASVRLTQRVHHL